MMDLEELWTHAERQPENRAAHELFIESCAARRELAFAARHYQAFKKSSVERGDLRGETIADEQLQAIQALAFMLVKDTTIPLPAIKRMTTWIAAVLCLILLLAVALAFRN